MDGMDRESLVIEFEALLNEVNLVTFEYNDTLESLIYMNKPRIKLLREVLDKSEGRLKDLEQLLSKWESEEI